MQNNNNNQRKWLKVTFMYQGKNQPIAQSQWVLNIPQLDEEVTLSFIMGQEQIEARGPYVVDRVHHKTGEIVYDNRAEPRNFHYVDIHLIDPEEKK